MSIAVDAEGGDYAPYEVVKGVIKAAQEYKVEITLVGRKDILHVLAGRHLDRLGMTIVDADEAIGFHEHPVEAVNSKPRSSIVVGTKLVKDGLASAFVSAGNTGAVFYAALSILGRIKRIEIREPMLIAVRPIWFNSLNWVILMLESFLVSAHPVLACSIMGRRKVKVTGWPRKVTAFSNKLSWTLLVTSRGMILPEGRPMSLLPMVLPVILSLKL